MENADDEAPKDPGIQQPAHQGYTEKDFEGIIWIVLIENIYKMFN